MAIKRLRNGQKIRFSEEYPSADSILKWSNSVMNQESSSFVLFIGDRDINFMTAEEQKDISCFIVTAPHYRDLPAERLHANLSHLFERVGNKSIMEASTRMFVLRDILVNAEPQALACLSLSCNSYISSYMCDRFYRIDPRKERRALRNGSMIHQQDGVLSELLHIETRHTIEQLLTQMTGKGFVIHSADWIVQQYSGHFLEKKTLSEAYQYLVNLKLSEDLSTTLPINPVKRKKTL